MKIPTRSTAVAQHFVSGRRDKVHQKSPTDGRDGGFPVHILAGGAAIAFYTVTSIAPVLLIVIAIAGLAFGRDAAQNALTTQLSGLMGQQTAEVLQTAVASASSKSSGVIATTIGIITLMVTASGGLVGAHTLAGRDRTAWLGM